MVNLGYFDEGVAGYVLPTQEPSTVPLYRVFNPVLVDHFYTTSLAEKNAAMSNLGYVDEGVAGYVYPDDECGGVPLYRAYSVALTDHFYTASVSEWESSQALSYSKEGIAAYIFAP